MLRLWSTNPQFEGKKGSLPNHAFDPTDDITLETPPHMIEPERNVTKGAKKVMALSVNIKRK